MFLMEKCYKIVLTVVAFHCVITAPTVVIVIAVMIAQIAISVPAVLNVLGVLTANGALVLVSSMARCI